MAERVALPGGRDVRAVLDNVDGERVVVACPPHPQMGGSKSDGRLTAVSDALAERGIDCLRLDYGPWDDGRSEVTDAENAVQWGRERYDAVALFGYSFGGGVALLAAVEASPDAVSVLAPHAPVGTLDAASAVPSVGCPLQVVYGERDDTGEWQEIVEAARERGATVETVSADHFFVGQRGRVAAVVPAWLNRYLGEE